MIDKQLKKTILKNGIGNHRKLSKKDKILHDKLVNNSIQHFKDKK